MILIDGSNLVSSTSTNAVVDSTDSTILDSAFDLISSTQATGSYDPSVIYHHEPMDWVADLLLALRGFQNYRLWHQYRSKVCEVKGLNRPAIFRRLMPSGKCLVQHRRKR